MTREETKHAISIMQAYVDGKTIQVKTGSCVHAEGFEDVEYPDFNWSRFYRIKEEPEGRRWSELDEEIEQKRLKDFNRENLITNLNEALLYALSDEHIKTDHAIRLAKLSIDRIIELNQLPKVEQREKWIPCSEMLPEENSTYLVTGKSIYTFKDPTFWTDVSQFEDGDWNGRNVIAWMPLPEPFKE